MKLEVGQKIGIYEVVNDGFYKDIKPQMCYIANSNNLGIFIYANASYGWDNFYMRHSEVRKVGSLIVKRLK